MCRGGGGSKMQELIYQIMPYKWGLRGKSRQISSCSSSHTDVSYFFNYFFRHVFSRVRFCFVILFCVNKVQGDFQVQWTWPSCCVFNWALVPYLISSLAHNVISSGDAPSGSLPPTLTFHLFCPGGVQLCANNLGQMSYLVSIQSMQCLWCSFHIYRTYDSFSV